MEKFRAVVCENDEFEYRDFSSLIAILANF